MKSTARLAGSVLLLLVALAGSSFAGPQHVGTYRGRVKATSSPSVPGFLPAERMSDMTIRVSRDHATNTMHFEVTDPNALGNGKGVTFHSVGTIHSERPVEGGHEIEVHFGGPAHVQLTERDLNQALQQVGPTKGLHVPVVDATGVTRVTFLGERLKLETSATMKRDKVGGGGGLTGGVRRAAAERLLPREMKNGFSGELTRQPGAQ